MNKAARANAHSATEHLPGRRKNERCIRGPLALRACEQFREMIQLRVYAFMPHVAAIEDASISHRDIDIFDIENTLRYLH